MLFQPSNVSPSTFSGIGAGTIDVTQGLTVSWQVNGDTPMLAYQITIQKNDTASTSMYSTGKITLSTPFQTHDRNGTPQFFSTQISASTLSSMGIVNGYANGYKIIIKQWWGSTDAESVEQSSASVFFTKAAPTLSIDAITASSISTTITATYSQAQGDPISTVEWIFAVAGSETTPIAQTGAITTQILSFDADGLIDGMTYSIECNVVTASGVYVSTGFVQFTVSYILTTETLDFVVGQVKGTNGVFLTWQPMTTAGITAYAIYRKDSEAPYLKQIALISASGDLEIVDYAIASQMMAYYVVIGLNGTTPVSVAQSQTVTAIFWDYSILLCYLDSNGYYHVDSEYRFGLNVETGAVSNNNEPILQPNFTPYPNRQPTNSLYKTGTLKSYIGTANSLNQYTDSISLQNAIYSISTSTLKKFLKTRKGEILMVETASSINMQAMDASVKQPMYATINWVEVGDASKASLISETADAFWPMTGDKEVYLVKFYVDNSTGQLMVNESDNLYTKASFSVDTSTGELMVTQNDELYAEFWFNVDEQAGKMSIQRRD